MDDLMDVMAQADLPPPPPATPVSSASGKRTANEAGIESDTEDDPFGSSPAPSATPRVPNQNLVVVAKRVGAQKKLKVEQLRDLQEFANVSLRLHDLHI